MKYTAKCEGEALAASPKCEGNDVGFGSIIFACAEYPQPAISIDCDKNRALNDNLEKNLARLPTLYKILEDDISKRLRVSNILITEYPDPTHNEQGKFCALVDCLMEFTVMR